MEHVLYAPKAHTKGLGMWQHVQPVQQIQQHLAQVVHRKLRVYATKVMGAMRQLVLEHVLHVPRVTIRRLMLTAIVQPHQQGIMCRVRLKQQNKRAPKVLIQILLVNRHAHNAMARNIKVKQAKHLVQPAQPQKTVGKPVLAKVGHRILIAMKPKRRRIVPVVRLRKLPPVRLRGVRQVCPVR